MAKSKIAIAARGLALALVFSSVAAVAGGTGGDDAKKKKDADRESAPVVITNETLERRFAAERVEKAAEATPTPRKPAGTAAEASGDAKPGKEGKNAAAKPRDALSPEQRAKRIAEIQQAIQRLEKRKLAIKNPFLAGTVPPTEQEKADEAGMDNVERLSANDKRIAELKKELAQLRAQGK